LKVRRLDHLVLTVKDPETTSRFYERVLGMEVRLMANGRTALHFGDQKINLHQVGSEVEPRATAPSAGSGDLCFVIDSPISDAAAELRKLDIPLVAGPVERTGALGAMQSLYFYDPDGNLIEVSAYDDGAQ
jgi:catechol 2,3-dioxygenase-like lactoylglutathione lyase family enzyme